MPNENFDVPSGYDQHMSWLLMTSRSHFKHLENFFCRSFINTSLFCKRGGTTHMRETYLLVDCFRDVFTPVNITAWFLEQATTLQYVHIMHIRIQLLVVVTKSPR